MLRGEKAEVAIRKRLGFLITFEPLRDRAGDAKRNFEEEIDGIEKGFKYHSIIEKYFKITNGLWREYRGIDRYAVR